MFLFLCLFLFGFCSACKTNEDCQLNGDCTNGNCVCDSAWTGPTCMLLNLKPAPLHGALERSDISSWGGSVVKIGNTYHMYAAEMANHCGLNTWKQNSIIIHATSDNPEGPFTKQDEVMSYFAHNPTVVLAPDNTILIYHIGSGGGGNPKHCTNGSTPTLFKFQVPPLQASFGLLYSDSPTGPWKSQATSNTCDGSTTVKGFECGSTDNPAPLIHPDGSVLVLARSWADNAPLATLIGVSKATTWKGPYVHSHNPIVMEQNEDPFLYKNARGYHALFHGMGGNPFISPYGRHAYSTDGWTWTYTPIPVYNTTVLNQDGKVVTYARRERPHLLFNENGVPTHLYTGVQKSWTDDYTFTHVQPINV